MHSGTRLTAKDAADAKTPANSMSPLSESNGRCPGPRFGQEFGKQNLNLILLTRAILGIADGARRPKSHKHTNESE